MKIYSTNTSSNTNIRKILIIFLWIAIWQTAYLIIGKDIIFPSPTNTFKALFLIMLEKGFYIDVGSTMYRVIIGVVISFLTGAITGILAYLNLLFRDIMSLAVQFLKSTPVMAVIIFALLWITSDNVPIFVCFLMCYPIVYTNILMGLDSINTEYIEMINIYSIRKKERIFYIYIPSVLPNIRAALSIITGLSWKSVVAAEVLSSPKHSMGYNLLNAKVYLETDKLFAWIIAIVILSMVFERIVKNLLEMRGVNFDRNTKFI